MRTGCVYVWTPDSTSTLGGHVTATVAPLLRLDTEGEMSGHLCGRHVQVRNGGALNVRDPASGEVRGVPIGDALPNADGDFLFETGRGGGRMDKILLASPKFQWRYIQASHF